MIVFYIILAVKYMKIAIKIDEDFLEQAIALSKNPAANLLIETALREYVQRREQLKVLFFFWNN